MVTILAENPNAVLNVLTVCCYRLFCRYIYIYFFFSSEIALIRFMFKTGNVKWERENEPVTIFRESLSQWLGFLCSATTVV